MMGRLARYAAVVASALTAAAGQAQTITWTNQVGGIWGVPGNWSPANVPDTAAENARIDLPGEYEVTVGANYGIGNLAIDEAGAMLVIAPARQLRLWGTEHTNNGVILLNTGSGALTSLRFETADEGGAVLGGDGTIIFSGNSGFDIAAIVGGPVINGPQHTITGHGRVQAIMTNEGVIEALGNNKTVHIEVSSQTNNSLMRAAAGGLLRFGDIVVTQSPGGVVRADDGGNIDLYNTEFVGGRIETAGSGLVTFVGETVSLRGVTLAGNLDVIKGNLAVPDTSGIVNNGTIRVVTRLHFWVAAELGGEGEVVLDGPRTNGDYGELWGPIINGPDHVIRGSGKITAAITNNGVIDADVPGKRIELVPNAGKTNNGIMRATNGGELWLEDGFWLYQGENGVIRAENGGAVFFNGAVVQGGTIESVGNGKIVLDSGLRDITFNADATIMPGGRAGIGGSRFTNNGVIRVNTGGQESSHLGTLGNTEHLLLDGTGEIILNGTNGQNAGVGVSTRTTMTQGPDHRIVGVGYIGGELTNNGLIAANVSGDKIQIWRGPLLNNHLLSASGGGVLEILDIPLTQGEDGLIDISPESTLLLDATTITGGTIETAELSHVVVLTPNTQLSDVALRLNGICQIEAGASLHVLDNTWTNNGVIRVNDGSATPTFLRFDSDAQVGGQGVLVLDGASPDDGSADLATNGAIVTWGPAQTLSGQGRIYGGHIWQGEIAPGTAAGRIAVLGSLKMADTSVYRCELGGTEPADHDRLAGSIGQIVLDGTLDLSLIDGFTPTPCDSFEIATGGVVSGEFDAITGVTPPEGYLWRVFVDGESAVLRLTCYPDADGSCTLDLFDVLMYLNLFSAAQGEADCNDDGSLDFFDVLCFLNEFNEGC